MAACKSIIQWNINSIEQNREELNSLITDSPSVVCLQETKAKAPIKLRNYTSYDVFAKASDGRACGGVSILINNNIPQSNVPINSTLQVVATRVTLHKTITICCIYCPPSQNISLTDFEDLLTQLPRPVLLLGDFNSHNVLWGGQSTTPKGRIVEDFINRSNLCLMNDGSFTYLHPGYGTYTAIDLTICDPNIFLDFSWQVSKDLCGSDHFPIFIESVRPQPHDSMPNWILRKANWGLFAHLCEEKIIPEAFENITDPVQEFINILIDIAEKTIPKSTGKRLKKYRPWFDEKCKETITDRKKALHTFNTNPTSENLNSFRIFRAKARRTIRTNKKKTWQDYVSKLNNRSTLKNTWDMIKKISGKNTRNPISHISKGNTKITETKDIANCLGASFQHNSSSSNYSESFSKHKQKAEKPHLNFKSKSTHKYNKNITLKELKNSILKAHDSSPGPDKIHYQFLKHLPFSCLEVLRDIFNTIWNDGLYPPSWSEARIIPIPKPNKDPTNETNYRPISLTSCLCKSMERIINNRLVWLLEKTNSLSSLQSGFRKSRSTTDHLIRLESFIRQSFVKGEHNVALFFDLEKAYETTWKYGIMKDLHDLGLQGNLPTFINKFLNDRTFQVRVGSTLSDTFDQESGVPQGSILSVTLFIIKINSVTNCLTQCLGTKGSLYVDDLQVCYSGKSMSSIERQLQLCLKKLEKWANENGFKFSTSKTVCVHFCRGKRQHPDPELTLNGNPIPVVTQIKFLGLIFDNKLNFLPHLKYLKERCKKALNLLRVVSHLNWGGDREVLLQLYKSLVLSKLDYGCFIYGSAPKSYIKMLDPIQNEGLRLCTGAYATSPIESLEVEANIPPLQLRREQLALQYITKLRAHPTNPAYSCIFNPECTDLFMKKPKTSAPLGIRIQEALDQSNIDFDGIAVSQIPEIPPWTYEPLFVNWELSQYRKSDTNSLVFQTEFARISQDLYKNYNFIYTDGSKDKERVGCAADCDGTSEAMRLRDHGSIFTAELTAIDIALNLAEWLAGANINNIICSDSQASLQALQNDDFSNPLVLKIRERIHDLTVTGLNISLFWIPGHVNIKGNEIVDKLAKNSLNLDFGTAEDKLPYTDLKTLVKPFIKTKWQNLWNLQKDKNKLFEIQSEIGLWPNSSRRSRREEIILSRLRIGHTYLTNSYLRKQEPVPECISCDCVFTVKHLLLECVEYSHIRENYFSVTTMKDLFSQVNPNDIITFIKDCGLFYLI